MSPAGVKLGIIASPPPETADDWFRVSTGVSGQSNNWLLIAEQAANVTNQNCIVCMGPRPILRVIPSTMPAACVVNVMSQTNPSANCSVWDEVHPLVKETLKKPIFLKQVAAGNFTCINMTGKGTPITNVTIRCQTVLAVNKSFKPLSRSDIWWWCGDNRLFDRLPRNVTGLCALVTLLFPVSIFPDPEVQLIILIQRESFLSRSKRSTMVWQDQGDPTYIDAIGVPRGVLDEYKLVDQVVSGFESSICWWCTINKNVDRINYIHYNVQKLSNWTKYGFDAVHEQLAATSLMAFQNRIALDMLLAEKGGVCAMFREQCCTFIPNNTAANGSLTKAIEGLRSLSAKMKEHSGVDTTMWDSWMDMFGKYKTLISSNLISVAVFAAILTLYGCCCIPCLRALLNRLITTAIAPMEAKVSHMYPLLETDDEEDEHDTDEE